MALTITVIRQASSVDGRRAVEADVQFSNPYVVGGEVVPLTTLGLKEVRAVELVYRVNPEGGNASTATNHGRQVVPDVSAPQTPKLKLFVSNTTESGAVDQTQVVQRVRFIGT